MFDQSAALTTALAGAAAGFTAIVGVALGIRLSLGAIKRGAAWAAGMLGFATKGK